MLEMILEANVLPEPIFKLINSKEVKVVKEGGRVILTPVLSKDKSLKMSGGEALDLLEKYRGRIKRDIDPEKERDEYLNEKYGPFD